MRRSLAGAAMSALTVLALSGALPRDARAAAALESIASQAAKTLGGAPALVVTAPLTTDAAAPRGEELAERVAQLVAGAMGGTTRAHPQSASLAQARAFAGGAAKNVARLVYVQPAIAKGSLRVTLDVYAVTSNGWDRVRDPAPPPSAHAFAEAPIDAEVRAFLASIPLEHASVHRAKHAEGEVLAAACGDLDGDGGMELALVSRARVAVGHVSGGRFVASRTATWKSLAPRVAVPMREALAGAAIVRDGERAKLLVGTTDRGGVALDGSLVLLGALRGIPVGASADACATASPEWSAFEGDVVGCALQPPLPVVTRFAAAAPRYDAIAGLDVARADGGVRAAQVAREPGGKLQLRLAEAVQALDGAGAQVALGDLDQDGVPEIAASAAEGEDAITVWSWDGASDPRQRLRLPAPGGVRALCTCPPEEGGAPALIAVVDDEVWIVR